MHVRSYRDRTGKCFLLLSIKSPGLFLVFFLLSALWDGLDMGVFIWGNWYGCEGLGVGIGLNWIWSFIVLELFHHEGC